MSVTEDAGLKGLGPLQVITGETCKILLSIQYMDTTTPICCILLVRRVNYKALVGLTRKTNDSEIVSLGFLERRIIAKAEPFFPEGFGTQV